MIYALKMPKQQLLNKNVCLSSVHIFSQLIFEHLSENRVQTLSVFSRTPAFFFPLLQTIRE